MMAGCLSQAKKILERYDEILYGPAPEELVVSTHELIAGMLSVKKDVSPFFSPSEDDTEQARDLFIKRIVEAVSPILPLTIRNKSLDGAYFRTALHLLGAVELMFSQYVADIRSQANPAGLVGMCDAMHADIKSSAVHSSGLRPLGEFLKDMRAQYNTSLGLGMAFRNDISSRDKRRGRGGRSSRNQGWRSLERFDGRNSSRGSNTGEVTNFAGGQRGQVNPAPLRGSGDCYAFLAGNCRRGGACRFQHRSA